MRGTFALLCAVFVILVAIPLISAQQAGKVKPFNKGNSEALPKGMNNNKNAMDKLANQRNGENRKNLSSLTPEERAKLLEQFKQNKQVFEAEQQSEGKAEDIDVPTNVEETRVIQKNPPEFCLEDESFEHYKLDPNGAVPDFLFLHSVTRPPVNFFSRFLALHDNIVEPSTLEPNFFSYPWISRTNARSYQALFANPIDAPEKSELVGDFSSTYLFHPLAPRRIASQIPHLKIIIILQNPVDRAYNTYLDRVNEGIETLTFEKIVMREIKEVQSLRKAFRSCYNEHACDKELCLPSGEFAYHDADGSLRPLSSEVDLKDYLQTSYLFRSIYDDMVERWYSAFPPENILVFSQYEFFKDKFDVMNNITAFLGLPEQSFTKFEIQKEEEIEEIEEEEEEEEKPIDTPINSRTIASMCNFFKRYNSRLYSIIGREFQWCAQVFQKQQQQNNNDDQSSMGDKLTKMNNLLEQTKQNKGKSDA